MRFVFCCLLSRVACHQLGYITGDYDKDFLESENTCLSAGDAPLFHVKCVGSERDLEECWRKNRTEKEQNCTLLHVYCSLNPGRTIQV